MNDEIYVNTSIVKACRLLPTDMFCKFYMKYSLYII